MKTKSFMTLMALVFWVAAAEGAALEPDRLPSLLSVLRGVEGIALCGEKVPLEIPDVRERLEKELLLSIWDRPQVILWLKRSRRYLPHIEKLLAENRMPDDLKFVAVAESALRPHAGSRKGAIGFWQFMPSTGRKYGLTIDQRIDERRDIFSSTEAAIRYFQALHAEFGSWTLSMAAYNMGEEGMKAEILAQGSEDYYRLYLPLETQRFIFRIAVVKLILSDPAGYGFAMADGDFYPPLAFDTAEIDCFEEIPIQIVAQAAGTYFKALKDLNPHIRGHYLGKGRHRIHIPRPAPQDFDSRFRQMADAYLSLRKERVYIVQKGDNLSAIAQAFDVPLAALMIWNRLDLKRPIRPGQRLVIHPNGFGEEKTAATPEEGESIDERQAAERR